MQAERNKVISDFKKSYIAETDFRNRLNLLWHFSHMYFDSYRADLTPILKRELEECKKSGFFDGEIMTRIYLSFIFFDSMDIKSAGEHMQFIMDHVDKTHDPRVRGHAKNFIAYIKAYQGQYDVAFNIIYELLREYPDVNDIQYGWLLYALGVFNFDIKDYENSEIRFREAIVHFTNCNFSYGITRSNTGLASVYLQHNDFKMAEELLQKSLHEYKKYESTSGESRVYNDLGTVYQKTGKPDEALNSFKKALEVRRIIPHQQGIATSLNEIASTLIDLNRHDEALPYLNEARDLSALINNKSKLYRTHFLLYKLYRAKENHKLALENFEIYDQVKSDVLGEASGNRIKALQTKMATEKSEKEAEIERLRNVELKSAYNLIEEKNKEILDSISYAKRIQQAILPSEKMVKKHLPESFVLYNPKDIVAGDFYWFHEITDSEFLIAACDCTGHGVPGALVSVVCHNALNRAVLEYKLRLPGEILDKTRQLVIEQFEKSDDGVKDGMDISLLYINTSARQCAWAGANNGLLVVCEGECTEYKPDKQPIGKFINAKNFITQKFSFEPGYMLYLFTDGYQDQFGGPKGKKFKASNLQKLLQSISNSPCDQQYNQLLTTFDQWRGPLEQVDDVCVLGLRL